MWVFTTEVGLYSIYIYIYIHKYIRRIGISKYPLPHSPLSTTTGHAALLAT